MIVTDKRAGEPRGLFNTLDIPVYRHHVIFLFGIRKKMVRNDYNIPPFIRFSKG
jgi:hypothetical protein